MKELDLKKSVSAYREELYEELRFDKHNLDEEYMEQARMFIGWALLYGQSLTLRKRAEAKVERVKGQMDLEIRKSPMKHGLKPDDKGKVMESAIKAAILSNKRVAEAQKEFYGAYALAKSLESTVKSFEQRKELLRGAGELWIHKYYSGIQVTLEDGAQREETKEEIHEGLSDRMRDRKRRNLE